MKKALFLSLAGASLLFANPLANMPNMPSTNQVINSVGNTANNFAAQTNSGAGNVINSANNAANEISNGVGQIGNSIGNIANGGNISENLSNIGNAVGTIGSAIGGFVNSVNSNLSKLTKVINDVQDNTIGHCYVTKDVSLDVCALIPKVEGSFDVCSLAPDIPGLKKKSKTFSANNSNLGLYCQNKEKYGGIGGTSTDEADVFNKGKEAGKSKKPNYKSAGQGGSLQESLKAGSPKNAAFKAFDQPKQEKITQVGENTGKSASEVTIEDIVATAPKDINEYNEFIDVSQDTLAKQSIEYTPYNFNDKLRGKLKSGSINSVTAMSEAKKVADLLDAEAGIVYKTKIADVFKKEEFLSLPTKEYIDILRDDIKIENVQKIDNQVRISSEIKAEVAKEYQKKKDLIYLTAQKAVIMNEKFDVQAAKAEVEALIK